VLLNNILVVDILDVGVLNLPGYVIKFPPTVKCTRLTSVLYGRPDTTKHAYVALCPGVADHIGCTTLFACLQVCGSGIHL
jgi:hypothetical protein